MIEEPVVRITLPSDVAQIDQTGHVWTFLDRAGEPERVVPEQAIDELRHPGLLSS